MTDQLEPKITNLSVAEKYKGGLRNRTTITWVPRLDLDDFESLFDSPRLVQRFLN